MENTRLIQPQTKNLMRSHLLTKGMDVVSYSVSLINWAHSFSTSQIRKSLKTQTTF